MEMRKMCSVYLKYVLCMILMLPFLSQSQGVTSNDLLEFCQKNGKRNLVIVSMNVVSMKSPTESTQY